MRKLGQNGVRPGFYPDGNDPWGFEGLSFPFHFAFFKFGGFA